MALLVYSLALTGDQSIRKWTVCVCVIGRRCSSAWGGQEG